jgi:hypothetical protein
MTLWDDRAAALQQEVRSSEVESQRDYDESDVRRATVHGREDIVLIVSYLSSLNKQMGWISSILCFIAITLLVFIVHSW